MIRFDFSTVSVHIMSCFKLPSSRYDETNRFIANFWCGQQGEECKVHWLSKSKLIRFKEDGGMGF